MKKNLKMTLWPAAGSAGSRLSLSVLAVLLLSMMPVCTLKAQQAIATGGGEAAGGGGTVSFTIGQSAWLTFAGVTGSVAHGVQHPYEISVITAIEETEGITLAIAAYPNPVAGRLTLKIEAYDLTGISYQLIDIYGRVLRKENIYSDETIIVMEELKPSVYFLRVTRGGGIVKIFRIIKR